VAIMSTGDELIDLNDPDESKDTTGGPYDTNRPSLKIMLEGLGYKVVDLGIAQDTSVSKYSFLPFLNSSLTRTIA
jgi:gephyrin